MQTLKERLSNLRLRKNVHVSFITTPTPVLLNSNNEVMSPNRTNYFPFSQLTLATHCKYYFNEVNIPWKICIKDFKSLSQHTIWNKELTEYGNLWYGNEILTKCIIGNGMSRLKDEVCESDIVCITANFTFEANVISQAINHLKKFNKYSIIIVGGRDASARALYYQINGADIVAIGDCENTLPRFLCKLYRGDNFSSFLDNKNILFSSSIINTIEKVHGLDFELLDKKRLNRYKESGGGSFFPSILSRGTIGYYETSRGCYRECEFCTERLTKISEIPVHKIKKDLCRYLKHGITTLMLIDDNLLQRLNKGAVGETELIDLFNWLSNNKFTWEFPVGLEIGKLVDERTNKIRHDLLNALLWNNDFYHDFFGSFRLLFPLENALAYNSNIKRKFSKMTRINSIYRVLAEMISTGIPQINLGIMFGFPEDSDQTKGRIQKNIDHIFTIQKDVNRRSVRTNKTQLNTSFFCVTPIPGTPFYQKMLKERKIKYNIEKDPELWNLYTSVLQGDIFSPESITSIRNDLLKQFNSEHKDGKVQLRNAMPAII